MAAHFRILISVTYVTIPSSWVWVASMVCMNATAVIQCAFNLCEDNIKMTTDFLAGLTFNSNSFSSSSCVWVMASSIVRSTSGICWQIAMIVVFSSMNAPPADDPSLFKSLWVHSKSLLLCILRHIRLHTSFFNPPTDKWMLQSPMRRVGKLFIHLWAALFIARLGYELSVRQLLSI